MEFKFDKGLKHHYIIGVAVKEANSSEPGKLYLKYGPIYFTNKDIMNVGYAKMLSEDQLVKTSVKDSYQVFGCSELAHSIECLLLVTRVNQCSRHHFSSEEKIDDDWFELLVDLANTNEDMRRKLNESTF